MRAVAIRDLEAHLSAYVGLAGAGEVVLVTDGDRVVAELVAPGTHRGRTDALWADLIGQGLARPPRVADGSPPPYVGGATSAALEEALDADRGR